MLSVHVHIYAYKTHCYNSGSATKPCHNVFLHVIAECMSMNVKEVTGEKTGACACVYCMHVWWCVF